MTAMEQMGKKAKEAAAILAVAGQRKRRPAGHRPGAVK